METFFTFIIVETNSGLDIPFLDTLLKLLKPSGRLVVPSKYATERAENLKLVGFIGVDAEEVVSFKI